MHFSCELLDQSTDRAGRLIALDLLNAAQQARKRLDDPDDAEALHDFRVSVRRLRTWLRAMRPWLEGSTPKRARERLEKAARLAGVSRDAEVHHQWLEAQRHGLSSRQRLGHTRLMRQIEREKHRSDRRVAGDATHAFDRACATLSSKLRRYCVDLEESGEEAPPSLAVAMAQLIRAYGVQLSHALAEVRSFADTDEAHEARIAGKRLRYLVEIVATCVRGGERLVAELSELQDLLGDWHDAEVFSAAIAKAGAGKRAGRAHDTKPGLRALSERLEQRGRAAFATTRERWGDATELRAQVDAIAEELSFYGHATHSSPALRLVDQASSRNDRPSMSR